MTTFVKDQTIYRHETAYRVVRPLGDAVQLENMVTGELSNHSATSLLEEYANGFLYMVPQKKHKLRKDDAIGVNDTRMDHLTEAARVETRRRVDYIVRLQNMNAFDGNRIGLRKAIAEVSRLRKEECSPHITTVYRWRSRFRQAGKDVRALISWVQSRGGKGRSRLPKEVEAIIHEKIETVFLANKCCSAETLYDAIFFAITQANTTRIEKEWLPIPGLRTIQRRIRQLPTLDITEARYGTAEAKRRLAPSLSSRSAKRILEIVEMDHTPVDLLVVNKDRVVIGRPTFTVLLDRYSRCVLGYHLSLAGHGTPAVFQAIRHALLPKTYIKHRYGDLDMSWDCYGWMERVVMDNGREFHAGATVDALMNLGIISEYAASRDPNDKPFVERFLKTFNYSFIHRLPGTTLAKLDKRIGFAAEDEACLTLEELNRMIHAWIMGTYHIRPHAGLCNKTPADVWRESARLHPPQLKENADDIDIELSEIATSRLQRYGIDLNNYRYASTRLTTLFCTLPEKSKLTVKWPRHDVGHIWVWDPLEKEYFKVENTDDSVFGLTLQQVKEARKAIQDNPEDKRMRAKTSEIVREIGAAAAADKKLKNRRKGARFENQTSKDLNREPSPAKKAAVSNAPPVSTAEVHGFAIDMIDLEGAI